jgi:hypothetical protein
MEPSASRYEHHSTSSLQVLLKTHQQTLASLSQQIASFGTLYVPAHLLNQHHNVQTALQDISAILESRGSLISECHDVGYSESMTPRTHGNDPVDMKKAARQIDSASLQRILSIYRQSLADLMEQAARFGDLHRPVYLNHEQRSTHTSIAIIVEVLRDRGIELDIEDESSSGLSGESQLITSIPRASIPPLPVTFVPRTLVSRPAYI